MKVIALNGGMGSGKSTAIDLLKETLPNHTIITVKFAETLYAIQEYIYKQVSDVHKRPPDFVKDRKLLQWLGTEWGRSIDEDLWVKIWEAKVRGQAQVVKSLGGLDKLIVVSDDCRFDNEALAARKIGGTVIKIERRNNQQAAQGGVGIVGHASEAGIRADLVDFIVENNSTIEDYKVSLGTLYREIGLI